MIDLNTINLSDISTSKQTPYIYRNKIGNLYLDQGKGFLAHTKRIVLSILGLRDYKLEHIFKSTVFQQKNPSKTFKKNRSFLIEKYAKQKGFSPETLNTIRIASQQLKCKPSADEDIQEFNKFIAKLSSTDSVKIKNQLNQFSKHLPQLTKEFHATKYLLQKVSVRQKWLDLGLDETLIEKDYQAVKYLVDTRLIYTIVGYQNSSLKGKELHALKLDEKTSKLMIKKEGDWVTVSSITETIQFNPSKGQLANINNPKETWNYYSPYGLVPIDRWTYPDFIPIEQLSEEEVNDLLQHAELFYKDTNDAPISDEPRNCVVQIFMNPRRLTKFDNNPFIRNLAASMPMHAAFRIVTRDGQVYSSGFGSTLDEDKYNEGRNNFLATINGMPTLLDYEEFRKHEGSVVTSIPITESACQKILEKMVRYRRETIRFNILRQNCTRLTTDILQDSGIKLSNLITINELFQNIIPRSHNFPIIRHIARPITAILKGIYAIEKAVTPKLVQRIINITLNILLFTPRKIENFLLNILALYLGAGKGSPKHEFYQGDSLENQKRLTSFSSLFQDPRDLFSDKAGQMYYSLPLLQWMLKQASTTVYPYYGKQPRMHITPLKDPELIKQSELLKQKFINKYIRTFEK